MSHTTKKKRKIIKNDKNEYIINNSNSLGTDIYNNNEYSLFNKKNIDLILNSISDDEKEKIANNKKFDKKDDSYNKYIFNCISCPNECHSFPLIMINSNKNIISCQCPANGLSNELTNPHEPNEKIEIPINQYLIKITEFYNNIKCSDCLKKYNFNISNNKNEISKEENIFFLCFNCNKYFCNKCKEEHIKFNNNENNQLYSKHYIINIESLFCYCLYHNEQNFGYCNNCKQNICIRCIKNKIHNSHDIVLFKNILINSKEVSEIKKKINIEKKYLNNFENIFIENINKLKTTFYQLLENKKKICKLKEILINEYESKSYNYQIIMSCLNMEFNFISDKIFNKMKDNNCLNTINLIFDILNNSKNYIYKESKIENYEKDNFENNLNNYFDKEKENKEMLKLPNLKKKKIKKKIISNSFSNNAENNNNDKNDIKNNIKKEKNNKSLLDINKDKIYNKNPIRIKLNNSILNKINDINKDNIYSSNNNNIYNKKILFNNLSSNKEIKKENSKLIISKEDEDNSDDDDLLFFPNKNSKSREQLSDKIKKKMEEVNLNSEDSEEDREKEKINFEIKKKSPKFRKNKIKKKDILNEFIFEDNKYKGKIFNTLNEEYKFSKELFDEEKGKAFLKSNLKENNINTIEKEKKNENEEIDNENKINNINKGKSLKKDKNDLLIMKKELNSSNDDDKINNLKNLNINLEKEIKSKKEDIEFLNIKNNNKNNFILSENAHKGNKKLNIKSPNSSGDLLEKKESSISNIKINQKRIKTNNIIYGLPPFKHSQDYFCNSNIDKDKNYLTVSALSETKSYDGNEESENYSDNYNENYEDNLSLKSKKKNIFEKKKINKQIKVTKNLIENQNKQIIENKEILLENSKINNDNKRKIYSIKIKNDPVWCVLSMNNNEYLSVGLASGKIRIFKQIDLNQKMIIEEHAGAIYSMILTKKNSNCFLSSSTDKLIKKILISDDFCDYSVLSTLKGHNSSVYKAIELNSNQILSCSDDGCLIIWENINKNKDSDNSSFNKLNFINDFLNINKDSDNNKINNISNKYLINKKLNQILNKDEIVYDILQINNNLFVSSSLYGYLRFWEINSLTNISTIKELQCSDSHNCLCIINKTILVVLLNEKKGLALVDYIKKEITHKIILDKDLEIKLSSILLMSNKILVFGGQNNSNKEENHVIFKFYKIIKVKKINSNNFKYSLKLITSHIKKSQKLFVDDDIWLNSMTEGNNGAIINGLGSTYMNEEYGQIYIFNKEIKNKNLKDINKENKNSIN